jgi:hypothetical protein
VKDNDGLYLLVAERLARNVLEGRPFDAAQIKIIGLEKLRRTAGADWPYLRESIRSNSLRYLQHRLAASDIVLPSEGGLLIIYAAAPARNLAVECQQIRASLHALFYKEAPLRDLRVEVEAHRLDPRQVEALGAQGKTSFYGPQGQVFTAARELQSADARETR